MTEITSTFFPPTAPARPSRYSKATRPLSWKKGSFSRIRGAPGRMRGRHREEGRFQGAR